MLSSKVHQVGIQPAVGLYEARLEGVPPPQCGVIRTGAKSTQNFRATFLDRRLGPDAELHCGALSRPAMKL